MAAAADGEAGRLATLMQVVHAITAAATDYERLLEVAARETARATATCCSIRLLSDDRRRLELASSFDPDPAWLARFLEVMGRQPIEVERSSVAAEVLRGGAPAVLPDLRGAPAGAFAVEVQAAMAALDMRALVIVPLALQGEVIGVFALNRHGEGAVPLDRRDVDLARVIADHAALSISNARLYAEARRELATRRRVETTFRISEEARLLAQGVVDTVRDPLLILDGGLRVLSGNLSYYETFRAEPPEVEGRPLAQVQDGAWGAPALLSELELTAREGTPIDGWEVEREFAAIGRRVMVIGARRIVGAGKAGRILLVISDVTRRVEAERSLRDYARRLEERTRELESANHELDSFSYSVSHDLRAPLRAIDGFARILAEDHGAGLDGEALRVLGVIRGNARKMAELIDDLLAFSRLGRKQLTLSLVDMDGMVRAIAREVAGGEPHRSIEVRVGPLPPAAADPALLTQVWVNLISNAVKYTRSRQDAIISIEGAEEADQVTYRIADNGVGFDMRYAHKLFGVFQRLHAASEFEGTGVGLALVRRIVIRHGGWISADGRPGEGATFEFALPRRE